MSRKRVSHNYDCPVYGVHFSTYLDNANIRHDLSTKHIKIPKSARKSVKKALSSKDFYILFTQTKTTYDGKVIDDYYIYAYRFQVLYGLRPGELIALEWRDIGEDSFCVQRAINAKEKKTDGKNEFVYRHIPLTPLAKEILAAQEKYRQNPNNPKERIFGSYGQICYRKRWKLYCEYNGISYITPYELRHTFASVNKFLPDWTLDVLMGHAHEGISLGIYAHALEGDMDNVAEILDSNLLKQIERGKSMMNSSPQKL